MARTKNGSRSFSQIDHVMTRDKRFREVRDPKARSLLLYYYASPNNQNGLVREAPDETAAYTGWDRSDVLAMQDDLAAAGRVVVGEAGFDVVLCEWRDWTGGSKHKDADGRVKVTKGIADGVRLNRQTLDDDIFDAYVESCGFDSSDALYGVLDEPDERGGDRRSSEAEDDPHPELTRKIADAFAHAFLSRKKYGALGRAAAKFRKAADWIEKVTASGEWSGLDEDDVIEELTVCVKHGYSGEMAPGNLSADHTWQVLMPQHLRRIYD